MVRLLYYTFLHRFGNHKCATNLPWPEGNEHEAEQVKLQLKRWLLYGFLVEKEDFTLLLII